MKQNLRKKTSLKSYFKELAGLFSRIKARDLSGKNLQLDTAAYMAVEEIILCRNRGCKVFIIGNGGSASLASHFAVDLWKRAGVKAITFNEPTLLTCVANDCGYMDVFCRPLRMFAEKDDIVIAISSSGRSKNILQAVNAARAKGCRIITLSGFSSNNPLSRLGNLNFYCPAFSYGYVETLHSLLCHFISDSLIS